MSLIARGLGSRRATPSPFSSRPPASRTSNAQDRLRFVIDALTKPVQLTIHNQQRLEQAQHSPLPSTASSSSSSSPSFSSLPLLSSASSSLSAPSTLLRSQARLKVGYIDWDDGLSQVKSEVRDSEEGARRVWLLLSERLRQHNSDSRLLCLYVIDALFVRSAKFRLLVLDGLHSLLELCVGISPSASSLAPAVTELPAPPASAQQLREEAVATVKRWRAKYGGVYRVLELGCKYMLDALGMEDDAAARRREVEEKRREEEKEAEVLRVRFDRLREQWKEKRREMERCIDTVDGCVDVLFPPEDEWEAAVVGDDEKDSSEVVHEHAIIDSSTNEAKEASEDAGVEWEDDGDDGSHASNPQPSSANDAVVAEESSRVEVEAPDEADGIGEAEEGDVGWEDGYLQTGGGGEVWRDEVDAAAGEGQADDGEEWDVQRVVADAGLGSRVWQLDIDFDSNLGRMEDEDNVAVFEALRDSCRLIQRTHLPQVSRCRTLSTPAAATPLASLLLTPSPSSPCCSQLIEWRELLKRVQVQPSAGSHPTRSVDDALIHTAFLQRERASIGAAVDDLINRLQAKVTQCAQLNVHVQQRSTLLSQMDQRAEDVDAGDTSRPGDAAAGSAAVDDRHFFGALQRRRREATKKVDKLTRKRTRRQAKDKFIARPSDAHKKVKL